MPEEKNRPVITKELLRELGDWRAEKEGREIAVAGNVLQWEYKQPFLSGTVRTRSGATFSARIQLGARAIEVENLCVCHQARDKGRICAHVLALGYATMQKAKPVAAPSAGASVRPRGAQAEACDYISVEDAGDEN